MAYEKQEWAGGDIIKAYNLNHIENGIYAESESADQNASDIEQNTKDIASNKESIEQNAKDIEQNAEDIASNKESIEQNAEDISELNESLSSAQDDISQNTNDIEQNASDITSLNSALAEKIQVKSYRSSAFDIAASTWVASFSITFDTISGYTPYLIDARVGAGSSGYAYINIANVVVSGNTITFGARNLNTSDSNFNIDYVILYIKN